jgi:hypothetical protein
MPGEAIIGAVAVALDRAAKIDRNKLVQLNNSAGVIEREKGRPETAFPST